jgi:phosphonate ABC transporter permease subunit PhnE/phosphonate ABC transporter binding protein
MTAWLARLLSLLALAILAAVAPASAQEDEDGDERRVIRFGIIATESSQTLEQNWRPFLRDMSEWTGYEIEPFYASDYAGVIEAMRFGQIEIGWFSNFSGLQAVRRANAEVFAKATYPDGSQGYHSVVIVPRESPLRTIEDALTCDGSLDFGFGDVNSTSGFLVPTAFIFGPRGIDPQECFASVVISSHEANAVAAANAVVDLAMNNSTNLILLERNRSEIVDRVREIWRSPLIPTDPILWRRDLDLEAKRRLQFFFMNYGRMGSAEDVAEARGILEPLFFGPFLPADNSHLDPVVQLDLTRDLLNLRNDDEMEPADRDRRIAELEAELAALEEGGTGILRPGSSDYRAAPVAADGEEEGGGLLWGGLLLAGAAGLMSLLLWAGAPRGPGPHQPLGERLLNAGIGAGVAVLLVWSVDNADIDRFPLLVENADRMGEFLSGFLPDSLSAEDQADYFDALQRSFGQAIPQMVITVQIALWGTFIAVVAAIPFGLLSARNVAPIWIVQPVRRLMDVFRSINELIIALVFIVAVGLGPFAGVMALAFHTTGVLAKLFSEAVESVDPQPIEGVRATGARPIHEVIWGVIPQVAPLWTSFGLYRFESNARSATVLGLIGAGGIGQILFEAVRAFDYQRTAAIVITIVVAVSLIDLLSQLLRKRLV